jgi:hypothetical protein
MIHIKPEQENIALINTFWYFFASNFMIDIKMICYEDTKILFFMFFFVPWCLGGRMKEVLP